MLTELPKADLRAAGDAIETLIEFRAYLPPAGPLVMLAGKFRDDIRDALGYRHQSVLTAARRLSRWTS
jgi:hypothetical protein